MRPNDKTACKRFPNFKILKIWEGLYVDSKRIEWDTAIVFLFLSNKPHKISNHKNRIQFGKSLLEFSFQVNIEDFKRCECKTKSHLQSKDKIDKW